MEKKFIETRGNELERRLKSARWTRRGMRILGESGAPSVVAITLVPWYIGGHSIITCARRILTWPSTRCGFSPRFFSGSSYAHYSRELSAAPFLRALDFKLRPQLNPRINNLRIKIDKGVDEWKKRKLVDGKDRMERKDWWRLGLNF